MQEIQSKLNEVLSKNRSLIGKMTGLKKELNRNQRLVFDFKPTLKRLEDEVSRETLKYLSVKKELDKKTKLLNDITKIVMNRKYSNANKLTQIETLLNYSEVKK